MDKPLSKQSAAPPFVFSEGAQWVRADFHLHTRADREFKFAGDDSFYHRHYVDALAKASIRLGVITRRIQRVSATTGCLEKGGEMR